MSPIAVVIVHWNQPYRCADTVRSFRDQGITVDLLIVDNGSTAENLSELRRMVPDVSILELGRNAGFGPGANCGLAEVMRRSDTEFIALAPHDALPAPGCLQQIRDALDEHPQRGAASAEYGKGQGRQITYSWVWGMHVGQNNTDTPVGWNDSLYPHGTLILFRRACLEDVGAFDERYFAYSEEHDWGLRARKRGWKIGVIGGAGVQNPIRAAASTVVSYLNIRNSLLLVRDHSGFPAAVVRTIVIVLNTVILWVRPGRRQSNHSTRVRMLAVRHFWESRFGPPPTDLS